MNARANTLEALQIAAGSPRMYCCSALDEQLMRTHRRLLMRLGSGRDTLVWQSRIDAPPAVVWQAAAASIETFFSNVPNVERVEPINGTDSREGSRYVIRRCMGGAVSDRVGEILVSVPGAILTASDIDLEDASPAGALPSLHGISVYADPDHPGRTILQLVGVTLGCYNMWMLPEMKAQAASIAARVERALGRNTGSIYRLVQGTPMSRQPLPSTVSVSTNEPDRMTVPALTQITRRPDETESSQSTRYTNNRQATEMNTTSHAVAPVRRPTAFGRWLLRLAALMFALTVATQAQQSSTLDLSLVHRQLQHRGPYQYDMRYERIWLADQESGRIQVSVTADESSRLALRGVIGRVDRMDPGTKAEVMSAIEMFNFLSSAGRMSYDEATGELRLASEVPAGTLEAEDVARRVVEFTDIVREESRQFTEARASGQSYCAVKCKVRH